MLVKCNKKHIVIRSFGSSIGRAVDNSGKIVSRCPKVTGSNPVRRTVEVDR